MLLYQSSRSLWRACCFSLWRVFRSGALNRVFCDGGGGADLSDFWRVTFGAKTEASFPPRQRLSLLQARGTLHDPASGGWRRKPRCAQAFRLTPAVHGLSSYTDATVQKQTQTTTTTVDDDDDDDDLSLIHI